MKTLSQLFKDESGVTAVEYALLGAAAAAVFSVAGSTFYTNLGASLDGLFVSSGGTGGGSGGGGSTPSPF